MWAYPPPDILLMSEYATRFMEWNGPRCPEGGRKLGEEEEEGCDATRRIGLTRGQKKKPQGERSFGGGRPRSLVRLPVPDRLLRSPA